MPVDVKVKESNVSLESLEMDQCVPCWQRTGECHQHSEDKIMVCMIDDMT